MNVFYFFGLLALGALTCVAFSVIVRVLLILFGY